MDLTGSIRKLSVSRTPMDSWGTLFYLGDINPERDVLQDNNGCGYGNLGQTLNANNYYVSDTNYSWDFRPGVTDKIGDHTDTTDWLSWFNNTIMPGIYANNSNSSYTNTITEPTVENEIIMFKSCYPNSDVGDAIDDEQAIYNSLLPYFLAHPDKMFILCVPPPQITISNPTLTRTLANWLCDSGSGWLSSYTGDNVFVFDLYNVDYFIEERGFIASFFFFGGGFEYVGLSGTNQEITGMGSFILGIQ